MLASALLFFLSAKRGRKKGDKELHAWIKKIDVSRLGAAISGEDPKTIARMLSYMEPKRAESLLAALPEAFQEEVLAKMEEES